MVEPILGRLESDKPEKKKKTIFNRQIYSRYTFTSKGEIKIYRFESVIRCFSRYLISIFGEKKLEIIKTIIYFLIVAPCLVIFYLMYLIFTDSVIERYEPTLTMVFFMGIISFFLAQGVAKVIEYHRDLLCRFCGKRFACEEIKEPTINEISTDNEYTVTVTRHWKCKFCGRVDIREGPENITARKGDYQSRYLQKRIRCENCWEKSVTEEFKKPDVRVQGDKRITRNYYRCNNCGYIDIREKEEKIYNGV